LLFLPKETIFSTSAWIRKTIFCAKLSYLNSPCVMFKLWSFFPILS